MKTLYFWYYPNSSPRFELIHQNPVLKNLLWPTDLAKRAPISPRFLEKQIHINIYGKRLTKSHVIFTLLHFQIDFRVIWISNYFWLIWCHVAYSCWFRNTLNHVWCHSSFTVLSMAKSIYKVFLFMVLHNLMNFY